MKTYFKAAAVLAAGSVFMLGTAPAMARVDVALNIGVPGWYAQPAPIYVQPRPVYVPRPVYAPPPTVYVEPPPMHWREHQWRHHHMRGQRDWDGDGIPNRFDRDRDGDGVPNYYDRRPNNPSRY
jgi:hypothetical protein